MQNKDLGFDKEHLLYVYLNDDQLAQKYQLIRNEFEDLPEVQKASVTSGAIGEDYGAHGIQTKESSGEKASMINVLCVDDYFQETMGMELMAGHWFSPEHSTDAASGFIVNESAVKHFGWTNPIGEYLNRNGQKGEVIGIVKDFHYEPLHQPIKPVVMYHSDLDQRFAFAHDVLVLKLQAGNVQASLNAVRKKWTSLADGIPFDFRFLDDHLLALYQKEYRFGILIGIFSGLAIFIACLGLIGLSMFSAQQRVKEIGIRKVFRCFRVWNCKTIIKRFCNADFGCFDFGYSVCLVFYEQLAAEFCLSH